MPDEPTPTGTPTPAAVRERLDRILDPCSAAKGTDCSIVDLGLVDSVEVEDGAVTVRLRLTSPGCMMIPYFHREVDDRVGGLPGVESVELETDSGFEWHRGMMTEEARRARERRSERLRARYADEVDGVDPADAAEGPDPAGAGESADPADAGDAGATPTR